MRYVIRVTACERRRHRGWPARALFFVFFLIAPLPDWKPPTASTTCHDPAPPEYDGSPSNEGILECPEHACTSRRLPQPRHFFSLRSEEHTSELQSLMRISYAVFCLKKKTNKIYISNDIYHSQHKTIH